MPDLTEDEQSCLLIAYEGGWMIAPIGRWKVPVENLALKGLMYYHDAANYGITGAGREAAALLDKQHDAALGRLIERSNVMGTAQKRIIDFAEQAAQLLAASALASQQVTGDSPEFAARQWSDQIYQRAMQLLREKQNAISKG